MLAFADVNRNVPVVSKLLAAFTLGILLFFAIAFLLHRGPFRFPNIPPQPEVEKAPPHRPDKPPFLPPPSVGAAESAFLNSFREALVYSRDESAEGAGLAERYLQTSFPRDFWALSVTLYQRDTAPLRVMTIYEPNRLSTLWSNVLSRFHDDVRLHQFEVKNSSLAQIQLDWIPFDPEPLDPKVVADKSVGSFEPGVDGLRIALGPYFEFLTPTDAVRLSLSSLEAMKKYERSRWRFADWSLARFARFSSTTVTSFRDRWLPTWRGVPIQYVASDLRAIREMQRSVLFHLAAFQLPDGSYFLPDQNGTRESIADHRSIRLARARESYSLIDHCLLTTEMIRTSRKLERVDVRRILKAVNDALSYAYRTAELHEESGVSRFYLNRSDPRKPLQSAAAMSVLFSEAAKELHRGDYHQLALDFGRDLAAHTVDEAIEEAGVKRPQSEIARADSAGMYLLALLAYYGDQDVGTIGTPGIYERLTGDFEQALRSIAPADGSNATIYSRFLAESAFRICGLAASAHSAAAEPAKKYLASLAGLLQPLIMDKDAAPYPDLTGCSLEQRSDHCKVNLVNDLGLAITASAPVSSDADNLQLQTTLAVSEKGVRSLFVSEPSTYLAVAPGFLSGSIRSDTMMLKSSLVTIERFLAFYSYFETKLPPTPSGLPVKQAPTPKRIAPSQPHQIEF